MTESGRNGVRADGVEVSVVLPAQLRRLARVEGDVRVRVRSEPTVGDVLDALEAMHPSLRGTIRDPRTGERRAYVRYFACGRDVSRDPPETPLATEIVEGREVFRVLGAISGG